MTMKLCRRSMFALAGSLLAPLSLAAALPNAWQITDNSSDTGSTFYYFTNLPVAQQIAATNVTGGFRFSVNARFVTDFNDTETMTMFYGLGTNRFLIWWDLDSNDNLTARLEGGGTYVLTTNGTGSALYHTHEIIYDAANGTASYVVDGEVKTNNWHRSTGGSAAGQVAWGAGSSAGQGQMNFNRVTFEITGTVVADYDAEMEPTLATDPRTLGWTNSPPSTTSTNGVSPDRGAGVVTTLADSGYGSLRQAIANAHSGDTISFFTNGTLRLTSAQLTIGNNLTIVGPGPADLRLDGNDEQRVFRILAGATVKISGLTITNGHAPDGTVGTPGTVGLNGGGIHNAGVLTLSNCVIVSNRAGNGGAGSQASYPDSIYDGGNGGAGGNGGGIYSLGSLTLISCAVRTNFSGAGGWGGDASGGAVGHLDGNAGGDGGRGGFGGGIYAGGSITLIASAVALNHAGWGGDGARGGDGAELPFPSDGGPGGDGGDSGSGAGVYVQSGGFVSVNNCTIANNRIKLVGHAGSGGSGVGSGSSGANGSDGVEGSGGGAYVASGTTATITSSTIVRNRVGGGIWSVGSLVVTNSIVALNDDSQIVGLFVGANNLTNGDPQLAPLDDYGGPTPTAPPLVGSAAIDNGLDSAIASGATDQRGYARLSGAHADIGAVEVEQFVVTNTEDSGAGSLRQKLAESPRAGLVTFAPSLSGQTITLSSGELLVKSLGVDASSLPGGLRIDAGGNSRIFEIAPSYSVGLASLTLMHGNASGASFPHNAGGGVFVNDGSTLRMNNCTLTGNVAATGGGIYNDFGDVYLYNCTLAGNSASSGGAIDNGGSLGIIACTIVNNSAANWGGGINQQFGFGIAYSSIIAANAAASGANIFGGLQGLNNLTSGDPLLAALGDYGGATPTMPPLAGSRVIDAGADSIADDMPTDQRGYPRLSGAGVDIGAAEAQVASAGNRPLIRNPAVGTDGALRFSFTNAPYADFTVLAATNIALPPSRWTRLGLASPIAGSLYQFTDPTATNYAARFYKLFSP
jgi:hypothetical protein